MVFPLFFMPAFCLLLQMSPIITNESSHLRGSFPLLFYLIGGFKILIQLFIINGAPHSYSTLKRFMRWEQVSLFGLIIAANISRD